MEITSTAEKTVGDESAVRREWADMATNDVGVPFQFTKWTERSVQVSGIFGGANLHWEGSNDGENYYSLTDPRGNPLDFISARIEAVTEICFYARPRVSGGDDTTCLTVTLAARK